MVSNGRGSSKGKHNPLRGHYARRNPDDDLGDLEAGSTSDDTVTVRVAPSEKKGRGRPKGSTNKKATSSKKAATGAKRGRPAKVKVEGEASTKKAARKALTAKSAEKHLTDILKMVRGLEKLSAGGKGKTVVAAAGGRVHYPALKIQVVTSGSKKSASKKAASGKTASGAARKKAATHINEEGRKVFTASGKPAGKPKKVAIAANGRRGARRNPDETPPKPKHQSTKIGPYKLTLLKNPITDFKIAGVKVVPAVAGTIGTVALSQFIKNLTWVSDMDPGVLKNIIPSAVTVAIGALAYGYCKKNNQPLFAEMAESVVSFGLAFGVNEVVEAKVAELVGKIKMPAKSEVKKADVVKPVVPSSLPPPVVAPGAAGLGSGRFMRQRGAVNGGAWGDSVPAPVPTSGLNGFISRPLGSASAPGYAPFQLQGGEGSSGYPDFQDQLAMYANSAETARSLMNGGAFHKEVKPVGHDLSGFAD